MLQIALGSSCVDWASVFEWHKRFKEGRESVRDDESCGKSKEVNTPELIGKHYSNRVTGLSTRTIHQSTTPSLSQTIWLRWSSKQFLTLLMVQSLLLVTFGYSQSSEAVVMRRRDERGCDEGHRHAHTRGLPWVLPEVVGYRTTSALKPEEITSKGTRVSCV